MYADPHTGDTGTAVCTVPTRTIGSSSKVYAGQKECESTEPQPQSTQVLTCIAPSRRNSAHLAKPNPTHDGESRLTRAGVVLP